MMRRLAFLLMFLAAAAQADEAVSICFNYGCAVEEPAVFSEIRLTWAEEMLAVADAPEKERQLLSLVIGRLYAWAGQQTPVNLDRAGNFNDDGVRGAMDCIDHSTTTTRFLRLLERRGALRFHRVLEPAQRGLLIQHFSAQIEEIGPRLMHAETEHIRRFAVDSWYVDNGRAAPVIPIEFWREGKNPDV
jgi:hypothetical protein